MAGQTGTAPTSSEQLTEALVTLPHEELVSLLLNFGQSFARAVEWDSSPEIELRTRATVEAMSVEEIAALLAPLVAVGRGLGEEVHAKRNRGQRGWNPARF